MGRSDLNNIHKYMLSSSIGGNNYFAYYRRLRKPQASKHRPRLSSHPTAEGEACCMPGRWRDFFAVKLPANVTYLYSPGSRMR